MSALKRVLYLKQQILPGRGEVLACARKICDGLVHPFPLLCLIKKRNLNPEHDLVAVLVNPLIASAQRAQVEIRKIFLSGQRDRFLPLSHTFGRSQENWREGFSPPGQLREILRYRREMNVFRGSKRSDRWTVQYPIN